MRTRILAAALLATSCSRCATPQSSAETPVAGETPQQAAELSAAPSSGTDCHVHLYESDSEGRTRDGEELLEVLDEADIRRACVLGGGYKTAPSCDSPIDCTGQRDFSTRHNDWVLDQAASSPRLLGFCGLPLGPTWVREELMRCHERGTRGVKLHPVSAGQSLRDPAVALSLVAIARLAAEMSAPVLIHIDHDSPDEIEAFYALADEGPDATFILAHFLAPNLALLPEAPSNVWADLSGLAFAPPQAAGHFLPLFRAFGTDRLLLGSDWPLLTPKAHLAYLRSMGLEKAEIEAIVAGNARRLLP